MDGAPACPFVAFGDDRDGRSTSPDHRHRCFAESPPAPRAVAHQEAYCLSSAFPVCPTFQDWARREAAHARGAGDRSRDRPERRPRRRAWTTAAMTMARRRRPIRRIRPFGGTHRGTGPRRHRGPPVPPERRALPVRRAPVGVRAGSPEPSASEFLDSRSVEGQGLAGSAADRLAGAPPPPADSDSGNAGHVAAAAGAVGAAAAMADGAPHEELAGLAQARPATPQTPPRIGGRRLSAVDDDRETSVGLLDPTVRRHDRRPGLGGGAPLRGVPDDPIPCQHAGPAPDRRPGRSARDRRARPVHAAGAARDRWRWRAGRVIEPQPTGRDAQRRDHAACRRRPRRST